MTTYKVMTTMKASVMEEVPDERYSAAKRGGYSVAHLGPGSATEQEMLETWLLLEVGFSWLNSLIEACYVKKRPMNVRRRWRPGCCWR